MSSNTLLNKARFAGLALFLAASAQAAPITSLYSTGLNASGTAQLQGSADAHYTATPTGGQAIVRTNPAGSYVANDANSQWIWQQANGTPLNTTLTFTTTFDLTGLDESTAVINGRWGTDNIGVDIKINGVSTGISLPNFVTTNFSQLHAFTITTGFIAGLNTLEFVVEDRGVQAAFRAELSGTADLQAVPEPATLAIVGLGLLGVGLSRRRRA